MCKNKIFYILNIIVKTGTLNFYCRYLSIKSLVVGASDTTNMGKEVTNLGANMGTTDMGTKFEYRSQTQDLYLLRHPRRNTL